MVSQTEAGAPMGSLGGSQAMGLPGVSGGPPLGPFGLLGQVGAWPALALCPLQYLTSVD